MNVDLENRFLVALPVFNEVSTVQGVLDQISKYARHILVVDDGSTDGTSAKLRQRSDIRVIDHVNNRGYGAALKTAFDFAVEQGFEVVVTIDCDGQHEPQRIRDFVIRCLQSDVDIISGSRYLKSFESDSPPPEQRRAINFQITRVLNERLGFSLTDAFCGFKAYRVESLKQLSLTDSGYAMPLELWVQAACHGLKVEEIAVPRIYLDENRSFGEELDDPQKRLRYYRSVLKTAFEAAAVDCDQVAGSIEVG